MNDGNSHISQVQRSLFERLQSDINYILVDISRHLHEEEEEALGLHFDVDLVLNKKYQRTASLQNTHKKNHGRAIPQLRADHELNHYNPHFYKAHIPDSDRRPMGRLSQAAHFFFQ